MAIVKKKKKEEPTLPAKYHDQADRAVRFQVIGQFYEERYKGERSSITQQIEADPTVTAEQGKSLRWPHGLWRAQERTNYAVDTAKIAEAMTGENPRLTLYSLLALVKKFDVPALQAIIPDAVSEDEPTGSIVMQANAEYKAAIISEVEEHEKIWAEFRGDPEPEEVETPVAVG